MTWGIALGSQSGVLLQLPDSLSFCIEFLELVKDLTYELLLMQEFLKTNHCDIFGALLLARLSVEVLMNGPMRLPLRLPLQVHGAQVQAGRRNTPSVGVYLGMSVAGSVEGLVELVHVEQLVVALGGLVGVDPVELPEVVFEELVEVLVEVPAGLVLVGSVEDSGLPGSLLAVGPLVPFYTCLVDPWDLDMSTSPNIRLQLHYMSLSGSCLSTTVVESPGSSFCRLASEVLHQLR